MTLTVNLMLHDYCRGWIIEKMALKLCAALNELGVIAKVTNAADPEAAVNHFMIFHYVSVAPGSLNTIAVTHIDDALKIDMVRRHLKDGVRAAICMSAMTADQLAGYGVARDALTYVLPAHDNAMQPRRIVIGITSNNYSDGRKRDWLLTRLANEMRLEDFEFQIFGSGWEGVAQHLSAGGAQVLLTPPTSDYAPHYALIKAALPRFDYYFYPGLDEGSMGTMDALSAGVKTIITRQGFHLDIPGGVTHGFWDYEELLQIFEDIRKDLHSRIDPARAMTWSRYAQRHLDVWTALIEGRAMPTADILDGAPSPSAAEPSAAVRREFPLVSYRELMRDPFRRAMALRFWIPRTYAAYLGARRTAGSIKRRLIRAH